MSTFKDLFSIQASDYALYRPTYPRALFDYLASLSEQKGCVWDVGTGNGQAAIELAKDFKHVMATDPSEKQIHAASHRPNITYKVEPAEHSSLGSGSINLITVAQAFHWFQHAAFAEECIRVAAPDAHLSVWTYGKATIDDRLDAVVDELYTDILESYWEKERKLVEEGYRSIKMPFPELSTPTFTLEMKWNVEQLVGYFKTWSALQSYLKKNSSAEPIEAALENIVAAWGDPKLVRTVRWPLGMRLWRITQ